jgi:DNA-binding CsgD family transcriptional regulator
VRDESLELRLGLMAQHALALGLAGEIEAGRDEARRFLAQAPTEPGELRQLMTLACVGFNTLLGKHADGRRLLTEELARLPDQLGHQAAELKYELATTYFFDADWRGLQRWSREALAADCQGMTRVGALSCLAMAEFNLGNLNHTRHPTSEAAQTFNGLADEQVAVHWSATIFLAQTELHVERLGDAVQHIERSIRISRSSGQRFMTVGLLAVHAQALAAMGRVAEHSAVAEAATETALLSTSDLLLTMAAGVRAYASLLTDDLHSALHFAEYGATAALGPSSPLAWSVRLVHAMTLLEMGEPERCREQLVGPDGEPQVPVPLYEGPVYGILIEAEIALSNLTRAQEFARRSVESAERLGSNLSYALAQRALAVIALARADTRAALTAALQSCEAAERAGARAEAARSQTLAGRAIAASGDRIAAITTLQAAHATLLTCGALHYSNKTAKELRRLGRAVPRSSRQHGQPSILGLTKREREVMEQVAAGKTNRQVAETLFLSARTVDRHLARIFEKLNVHSRAAATSTFTRATSQHQP